MRQPWQIFYRVMAFKSNSVAIAAVAPKALDMPHGGDDNAVGARFLKHNFLSRPHALKPDVGPLAVAPFGLLSAFEDSSKVLLVETGYVDHFVLDSIGVTSLSQGLSEWKIRLPKCSIRRR